MSVEIETKLFVQAILRFLRSQLDTQTLTSDAAESLEVGIQCLENAYNLDNAEGSVAVDSDNPLRHINLFDLFTNVCLNVSTENKAEAESLKNEGNRLMKNEKYQEALNFYSRAINLDATNPVFYCNRAAAYSKIGELQKAIDDCKMSLRYDSGYSKAYGRLGLAYSKLNRHDEAIEAYKRALSIEPNNVDYQNNLAVTQERLNEVNLQSTNPLNAAAGAGIGIEGLGGLPGNIDFAEALNNPTLVNLATRIMSEPGVQNLLTQLSGMGNMDAFLETGRQLAANVYRDNPELITNMRQQFGVPPNGAGTADPANPQQPPATDPSAKPNEDSSTK